MASPEDYELLGKVITSNAKPIYEITQSIGAEVHLDDMEMGKNFNFLIEHGFVHSYGNDLYVASTTLYSLDNALNMRQSRKRTAPDVEDWFHNLDSLLQKCHYSNTTSSRALAVSDVKQHIRTMCFGLRDELHDLDFHLSSQFGFVENIQLKIIENENAVRRCTSYIEKLKFLDIDLIFQKSAKLSEVALCVETELYPIIKECLEKFQMALPKLQELLWSVRKRHKQTIMLQVATRAIQRGKLLLQSVTIDTMIESPINHTEKLEMARSCNVNDLHNPALKDLVLRLKPRPAQAPIKTEVTAEPVKHDESESDTKPIEKKPFARLIEAFTLKAIQDGKCNASTFYTEHCTEHFERHAWVACALHAIEQIKSPLVIEYLKNDETPHSGVTSIVDFTLRRY